MTLEALDHQEKNGHVEMTWRMLRTISHSLMVQGKVLEAYYYSLLIYTTDPILPVLTIKDLINKDSEPTAPFKLAAGTKPSISHLCVLFFRVLYKKLLHMLEQRR